MTGAAEEPRKASLAAAHAARQRLQAHTPATCHGHPAAAPQAGTTRIRRPRPLELGRKPALCRFVPQTTAIHPTGRGHVGPLAFQRAHSSGDIVTPHRRHPTVPKRKYLTFRDFPGAPSHGTAIAASSADSHFSTQSCDVESPASFSPF